MSTRKYKRVNSVKHWTFYTEVIIHSNVRFQLQTINQIFKIIKVFDFFEYLISIHSMNDEMSHVLTRQETSHDWSYRQLGQNLITPTALWLVGDCRKVSYWPGLQPIRSQTHVNFLSISTALRLIDPESVFLAKDLYVVLLRHKLLRQFIR